MINAKEAQKPATKGDIHLLRQDFVTNEKLDVKLSELKSEILSAIDGLAKNKVTDEHESTSLISKYSRKLLYVAKRVGITESELERVE